MFTRALPIMCVTLGVLMFANGYIAAKRGRIIPATTKTGPMTGEHAMFAGVVSFGCGLAMWFTVRRRK